MACTIAQAWMVAICVVTFKGTFSSWHSKISLYGTTSMISVHNNYIRICMDEIYVHIYCI